MRHTTRECHLVCYESMATRSAHWKDDACVSFFRIVVKRGGRGAHHTTAVVDLDHDVVDLDGSGERLRALKR